MHILLEHGKNRALSRHFSSSEFECKCKKERCNSSFIATELLDLLKDVRRYFGAPIKITSGYRCIIHNENVGGAVRSQHSQGNAADIQVIGVDPVKVQDYLEDQFPDTYGIGRYPTFTHIDVREKKARWGKNG